MGSLQEKNVWETKKKRGWGWCLLGYVVMFATICQIQNFPIFCQGFSNYINIYIYSGFGRLTSNYGQSGQAIKNSLGLDPEPGSLLAKLYFLEGSRSKDQWILGLNIFGPTFHSITVGLVIHIKPAVKTALWRAHSWISAYSWVFVDKDNSWVKLQGSPLLKKQTKTCPMRSLWLQHLDSPSFGTSCWYWLVNGWSDSNMHLNPKKQLSGHLFPKSPKPNPKNNKTKQPSVLQAPQKGHMLPILGGGFNPSEKY